MRLARMNRRFPVLFLLALLAYPASVGAFQGSQPEAQRARQAIQRASEADRQAMLDLLHITSLRQGVDAMTPAGLPGAANYDESKANPYPDLPDPLMLNNGQKVTTAEMWWKRRRPEIVEDFDREVYGRVPRLTPWVDWEVVTSTRETSHDVPVITKRLTGHVDNSSYQQIHVDIQLELPDRCTSCSANGAWTRPRSPRSKPA